MQENIYPPALHAVEHKGVAPSGRRCGLCLSRVTQAEDGAPVGRPTCLSPEDHTSKLRSANTEFVRVRTRGSPWQPAARLRSAPTGLLPFGRRSGWARPGRETFAPGCPPCGHRRTGRPPRPMFAAPPDPERGPPPAPSTSGVIPLLRLVPGHGVPGGTLRGDRHSSARGCLCAVVLRARGHPRPLASSDGASCDISERTAAEVRGDTAQRRPQGIWGGAPAQGRVHTHQRACLHPPKPLAVDLPLLVSVILAPSGHTSWRGAGV